VSPVQLIQSSLAHSTDGTEDACISGTEGTF